MPPFILNPPEVTTDPTIDLTNYPDMEGAINEYFADDPIPDLVRLIADVRREERKRCANCCRELAARFRKPSHYECAEAIEALK